MNFSKCQMLFKIIFSLVLLISISITHSGCAAIMAMRQPKKRNLEVLTVGVSRDNVISYLGMPTTTEVVDGLKVDHFNFKQGYTGGAKASRATMHIIFDLFTIFIWELIGMPIEAFNKGKKMSVKVEYDENDLIKNYKVTNPQ